MESAQFVTGVLLILIGVFGSWVRNASRRRAGSKGTPLTDATLGRLRSVRPGWVPPNAFYEDLGSVMLVVMVVAGIGLIVAQLVR